jgi:hypothetical protein
MLFNVLWFQFIGHPVDFNLSVVGEFMEFWIDGAVRSIDSGSPVCMEEEEDFYCFFRSLNPVGFEF